MIRWIDDICCEWGAWKLSTTSGLGASLPSIMGKLIETARTEVVRPSARIGRDPIPARETRQVSRSSIPPVWFNMTDAARIVERMFRAIPGELRAVLVVQYCYVGVDYRTRTAMVAELSGVHFSPATYYRRIDALHEFIAARICSAELQATNL